MNEQKDWTTSTRTRSIAYWVTTVLIAARLCERRSDRPAASANLRRAGTRLPRLLLHHHGRLEILGAAAVLAPRFPLLKEWAYAVFSS